MTRGAASKVGLRARARAFVLGMQRLALLALLSAAAGRLAAVDPVPTLASPDKTVAFSTDEFGSFRTRRSRRQIPTRTRRTATRACPCATSSLRVGAPMQRSCGGAHRSSRSPCTPRMGT